jgi:hypothetical protein
MQRVGAQRNEQDQADEGGDYDEDRGGSEEEKHSARKKHIVAGERSRIAEIAPHRRRECG